MELKGKRIGFLGDSITEGYGVSAAENRYTDVFARMSGAEVYNYGFGGTRIAKNHVPTPGEYAYFDVVFASRIPSMEKKLDVVCVFGGTNDFGHGDAPFGTLDDDTDETFCGAFRQLLEKLITKYPKALIVVMTPTHRLSEDALFNDFGVRSAAPLRDYVQAERDIAEDYGLPVLDLFANSGIQPKLKKQREAFMPDGLHPNDAGAARIAERLFAFLKNY